MPPKAPPQPNARRPTVAKRLSKARGNVTGRGSVGAGNASSSDSDGDGATSVDNSDSSSSSEEEDVDEKLLFSKFRDDCWNEITSLSLTDDIAALTGTGSPKGKGDSEGSDNIVVGFRIRPPRAVEGDEPVVTNRGVRMINFPTAGQQRGDRHHNYSSTPPPTLPV